MAYFIDFYKNNCEECMKMHSFILKNKKKYYKIISNLDKGD
jgi:hypothetical protein